MYIKKENGEIIYQRNDLSTCQFRVGIHEDGLYHIVVTGKKAQGKVKTQKEESTLMVDSFIYL